MKNIINFFYEIGTLKLIKRSGWWHAGIKDPESVADHSFRTILIGKILAEREDADQSKVMSMLLFHDVPEARINDLHKIGARYIDTKDAERAVIKDQAACVPKALSKEILDLFNEFEEYKTKEAIVARDADFLECAIQAKEYLHIGHKDCKDWIINLKKRVKTPTAKKLLALIEKTEPSMWWEGLKKIIIDDEKY